MILTVLLTVVQITVTTVMSTLSDAQTCVFLFFICPNLNFVLIALESTVSVECIVI